MSAALEQFDVGIRSRVPWDEYVTLPGTSITRLKEIERSPQHYLHRLEHPRESAPLQLGKAAHAAVLEPERFEREYVAWTRRSEKSGNLCPRNGQYWDAFLAENRGKEIITEDEHALALAIQKAVREHPVASVYLANGDPEVTMQWHVDGKPRKGRIDWLALMSHRVLVGLKTTTDCRHFPFGSKAAKLGYPLQWAWYYDGYFAIRGEHLKVVEIVVESGPPHAVKVYEIPPDMMAEGRDRYEALLKQLHECEATGEFPGPGDVEEILTLPTWYYETQDDLAEIGLE